jgi:hypothetical protein
MQREEAVIACIITAEQNSQSYSVSCVILCLLTTPAGQDK